MAPKIVIHNHFARDAFDGPEIALRKRIAELREELRHTNDPRRKIQIREDIADLDKKVGNAVGRDGFSPGQRATFKGMPVKVKGPGPSEGQVEVERISNGKTLVVSESLLTEAGRDGGPGSGPQPGGGGLTRIPGHSNWHNPAPATKREEPGAMENWQIKEELKKIKSGELPNEGQRKNNLETELHKRKRR